MTLYLFAYILTLADTYSSLRGHFESLEEVQSCLSEQSIAQSAGSGCMHSSIPNLPIFQAYGKSRKTYENRKEVHRSFVVIQSTDNFILL